MKSLKKVFYLFGVSALSFCCMDTLDTHPTETFDEETVWGSKATAEAFIYDTYGDVLSGSGNWAGSGSCVYWEERTPNSVYCDQVGSYIDYFCEEIGLDADDDWGCNKSGVLRKCNMILEKVNSSRNLSDAEKSVLLAHGHFLRGLVFFEQARLMGRFIPICQVFTKDNSEECMIPMTKDVAESYRYVIKDLEIAVRDLPAESAPGLPTRWAAGVVLSRACLQAYAYTNDRIYVDKAILSAQHVIDECGIGLTASQGMFNEIDDKNSEILWGYYRLPDNTSIGSFDELICTYPNCGPDDVATSLCPVPLENKNGETFSGWAVFFPTQDLVDQYLVTDEETGEALPWYETSQYKRNVEELDPSSITAAGQIDQYKRLNGEWRRIPTPQDFEQVNKKHPLFTRYGKIKEGVHKNISEIMYNGRDKRFAASVVYDGCKWVGEKVETNLGGNLSAGVRDKEDGGWYTTVTGYYWRKNSIENPVPRAASATKTSYHFNLARLGEAYMNLAEAQLLNGNVAAAVSALNATRTIHGGIAPSKATSVQEAWADYIRERNVEMTNEGGDIYFSYLRWGKYGGAANEGRAPDGIVAALNRPVYKIQITRDRSGFLISQITLRNLSQRIFTEKRYLLPINRDFLDTREVYGLDHNQNPGW